MSIIEYIENIKGFSYLIIDKFDDCNYYYLFAELLQEMLQKEFDSKEIIVNDSDNILSIVIAGVAIIDLECDNDGKYYWIKE